MTNTNGNRKELSRNEKILGVKIHALVYVLVSILLISINLIAVLEYIWAVYPVTGMGLGLLLHYILAIKLDY